MAHRSAPGCAASSTPSAAGMLCSCRSCSSQSGNRYHQANPLITASVECYSSGSNSKRCHMGIHPKAQQLRRGIFMLVWAPFPKKPSSPCITQLDI